MRLSLSYHLLVPLALTAVALVSGVAVALTTLLLVDRHVQTNAEAETRRLASTVARALVQPVLRNDIWQSYQLVRAATEVERQDSTEDTVGIVVIDAREQVFVSPTPRSYPLGTHLSALPPAMVEAARDVTTQVPPAPARAAQSNPALLVLAAPIVGEEDVLLGVVLATHPPGITRTQRAHVVRQLVWLGMGAIALVALAGAFLGLRLTAPLGRLRTVMEDTPRRSNVREQLASEELARVCQRADEVGSLARTFAAMLRQIAANQELERHMLEAERMASIGQLSAGIAHEVNNPLGGMLAAIQNRRLRGGLDEATARTLNMLERGLHQIHETVQALLNEARSEQRALRADDLHDLELLLRPEAEQLGCAFEWQVALPGRPGLPAVAVRQVILNLVLNAAAAAGKRGRVHVWSAEGERHWYVHVGNTGPVLDETRLAELTAGMRRTADGRLGLGLWITARILHTLGGELTLMRERPTELDTVLIVSFPFDPRPDELLTEARPPMTNHAD
jgi:signal transduction histidine kinase